MIAASSLAAARGIADPETCGEDLAANVRRALAYAPGRCGSCLDYHMTWPVFRHHGRLGRVAADRDRLIRLVERLVARHCRSTPAALDIVIAGAADTQVLASCAHAVSRCPEAKGLRTAFTVLDRCDTPLALCRDFAVDHDLNVLTKTVDLLGTEASFAADLLICHSLFNFIPADRQRSTLVHLSRWLKPGGLLIFYVSVRSRAIHSDIASRNGQANALIRDALDRGALVPPEPRADFERRLDSRQAKRIFEFENAAQVLDLFGQCGLRVEVHEVTGGSVTTPAGGALQRVRVLAALAPPGRP